MHSSHPLGQASHRTVSYRLISLATEPTDMTDLDSTASALLSDADVAEDSHLFAAVAGTLSAAAVGASATSSSAARHLVYVVVVVVVVVVKKGESV